MPSFYNAIILRCHYHMVIAPLAVGTPTTRRGDDGRLRPGIACGHGPHTPFPKGRPFPARPHGHATNTPRLACYTRPIRRQTSEFTPVETTRDTRPTV